MKISLFRKIKNKFDEWLPTIPVLYIFYDRQRHKYSKDQKVYESIILSGDIIFDVGANVGTHSAALARLATSSGHIYAMEPLSENVERMKKITRKLGNVTIISMAAGNPNANIETLNFSVPGEDFTQGSLAEQHAGAWLNAKHIRSHKILCTKIDTIVQNKAITNVTFMKFDCEGSELDALRGSIETIRKFMPILYVEVFERWTKVFGYTPFELLHELATLGYTTGRIVSKHGIGLIEVDQPMIETFSTSANVLLVCMNFKSHRDALHRFDGKFKP